MQASQSSILPSLKISSVQSLLRIRMKTVISTYFKALSSSEVTEKNQKMLLGPDIELKRELQYSRMVGTSILLLRQHFSSLLRQESDLKILIAFFVMQPAKFLLQSLERVRKELQQEFYGRITVFLEFLAELLKALQAFGAQGVIELINGDNQMLLYQILVSYLRFELFS